MFLKFYQGPRRKGVCEEKSNYSILLLLSVGAFKIFQVLFFYIKVEKAGVGNPILPILPSFVLRTYMKNLVIDFSPKICILNNSQ